jgi:hypothetical protein
VAFGTALDQLTLPTYGHHPANPTAAGALALFAGSIFDVHHGAAPPAVRDPSHVHVKPKQQPQAELNVPRPSHRGSNHALAGAADCLSRQIERGIKFYF